jgi:hypothetical protein
VSIRFLADADLNQAIVSGTRLREPSIDQYSPGVFLVSQHEAVRDERTC